MIVFDIECDGLYDVCTKIHVFSWWDGETLQSTSDYDTIRKVISDKNEEYLGHNICCFDNRVLKKILGVGIQGQMIDTLPLAWYVDFDENKHGLETYGIKFGIKKPEVTDWDNLSYEEYRHRCEEDVKINRTLWTYLHNKLSKMYPVKEELDRFIRYLTFKMEVAGEQSDYPFFLDTEKANHFLCEIERQIGEKAEQLAKAMPAKVNYKTVNKPKVFYKKDGSLSVAAQKWFKTLEDNNIDLDFDGDSVKIVDSTEEGNPNSNDQIKSWLYSLGWEPQTFKFVRNKDTGEERQIEQVRKEGELCPSVKDLQEKEPAIEVLDGLTVLQHRRGIFQGFLDCHVDGRLRAEIAGLTNTLRFKHSKPVVNLPGVDKPWGIEIRGCLKGPEGTGLVGADMVSLESTTKKHYLWPYDPEYVKEMSEHGYDEHLSLAMAAGEITEDEYKFFSWFKEQK